MLVNILKKKEKYDVNDKIFCVTLTYRLRIWLPMFSYILVHTNIREENQQEASWE